MHIYIHIEICIQRERECALACSAARRSSASRSVTWSSYDEIKSCHPVNFPNPRTQPFHGSSPSPWKQRSLGLAEGGVLPYEGARHCHSLLPGRRCGAPRRGARSRAGCRVKGGGGRV